MKKGTQKYYYKYLYGNIHSNENQTAKNNIVWTADTPKNIPPQQEFESAFTPVNSFESDVMGMTPISSMNEISSPNQGFTPLNSFENDVLGITLVNPDYQILKK